MRIFNERGTDLVNNVLINQTSSPLDLSVQRGDIISILATARDPEGVRIVEITGDTRITCISGGTAQERQADLISVDDTSGSTIRTRLVVGYSIDVSGSCGAGWTLSSVKGTFRASGRNLAGALVQTPAVNFKTQP